MIFFLFQDDCNNKSNKALSQLTFEHNGHAIKLDDLQLTFQYSPSSTVFSLDQVCYCKKPVKKLKAMGKFEKKWNNR